MDRGRKILANDCFQEVGSLHGLGSSRITEKIDIGREAGGAVADVSESLCGDCERFWQVIEPLSVSRARPAMRDRLVLSVR